MFFVAQVFCFFFQEPDSNDEPVVGVFSPPRFFVFSRLKAAFHYIAAGIALRSPFFRRREPDFSGGGGVRIHIFLPVLERLKTVTGVLFCVFFVVASVLNRGCCFVFNLFFEYLIPWFMF